MTHSSLLFPYSFAYIMKVKVTIKRRRNGGREEEREGRKERKEEIRKKIMRVIIVLRLFEIMK